jgi:hypothetical protein
VAEAALTPIPSTGGRRLKIAFIALLGFYAIAFLVGVANGQFGWWGEERVQRILREQALARLGAEPTADSACVRLQATFGTISRVSFVKDLDRPLPAIVARQRTVCTNRETGGVAERWILLGQPAADDTPICLAIGRKEDIDTAMRRCGFVTRRFS